MENQQHTTLEEGIYAALETYSNVHRGSGYKSIVTTHLYEHARKIVLEYLALNKRKYVVVFCTPRRAEILIKQIESNNYKIISSHDIGLPLGVKAIAIKKNKLPKGTPYQVGGGTTRLISKEWVDWASGPDKFEAGTPAIINIITFARALHLIKNNNTPYFNTANTNSFTIADLLHTDQYQQYNGVVLLNEIKKTIIGQNINLPTTQGTSTFINLDNSASTPTFEPVWDTYKKALQLQQHKQDICSEVKTICADILNANQHNYDIIFTSNTTEATNLIAENFSNTNRTSETVIISTLLEHSSNDLPWRIIPNNKLIRLDINADGIIDVQQLETLLKTHNGNVKLVTLSGASNVLGICNDIAAISKLVHNYGAFLMVDAAQLIAHREINMESDGIDLLVFSGHKVYAPFGVGALIARKGILSFSSDELQNINLSGEENVAGIAALGKALTLLQRIGMKNIMEQERALTAYLLEEMSQVPGIKIHGLKNISQVDFDKKLGVVVFELKGSMGNAIAKKLSLQNAIGIRYGCHCAHIIIKHLLGVGPGLEKFQRTLLTVFPKISLPGMARVSLGIENDTTDIDKLIHALKNINDKQSISYSDVKQQLKARINEHSKKVYL